MSRFFLKLTVKGSNSERQDIGVDFWDETKDYLVRDIGFLAKQTNKQKSERPASSSINSIVSRWLRRLSQAVLHTTTIQQSRDQN